MEHAIAVYGLCKSFAGRRVLDAVCFTVPTGSVLAVLGPNGAGKTTLVHILTTLVPPDAGSARVAGHDVVAEPRAVRGRIGVTGQYASVDRQLTGRENLVLLARLSRHGYRRATRMADAQLARFGLHDHADRPVATYSGGLRRRLDLAASLITAPAVLFLDEPTTGLDPASRHELWQMVRAQVNAGTTVLLTTQYLEEADQLANHVMLLDHGLLVANGTPNELKRQVGVERLIVTPLLAVDRPAVAGVLEAATGEAVALDTAESELSVRLTEGVRTVALVAAELDERGIAVSRFAVHRPSLDEVFLTLTQNDRAGDRQHSREETRAVQ